ncbi:MAG: hypothetical protein HYV14_06780 [Elusimicrobia bacterium]|nr:hypothetical protein [Elusimicrobiota bacterium]
MDALELAYTPHPAMRTRVSLMAPIAPSCREKETAGLAVAAVASLALIGAGAVLASPRVPETPETVAGEARPFERREAAQAAAPASAFAPMPLQAEPTPVETRSASPAPLLGDLGPEPEPEPAVSASIAYAPREQHVLTSFDGTRTLSDGPVITRAAAPAAAPEPRPFRPAPVVWNAPIQWISVHKAGL